MPIDLGTKKAMAVKYFKFLLLQVTSNAFAGHNNNAAAA